MFLKSELTTGAELGDIPQKPSSRPLLQVFEGTGTDIAQDCQDGASPDSMAGELFRVTRERFRFLEDEFFKLQFAKSKGGSRSGLVLEFVCVKCGSHQSISNFNYCNLRRHIARRHFLVAEEYDKLWKQNKRRID